MEQISESEHLKQLYEEKEDEKNKAEEATQMIYAKRKGVISEKSQKKEQKDEAEKHLALQKKLVEQKVQKFLFQLYHLEQDITTAENDIRDEEAKLEELQRLQGVTENSIQEKRKVQAKHMKDTMVWDKKVAKRNAELEKKVRYKK